MKKIVKEIKESFQNQNVHAYNRRELAEEYLQLAKIPPVSDLFKKIKIKCGNDVVHIIVDEFELQSLDNNQADNLDTMFNTADWKPSCVLLFPQPLERNHTIITDGKEISGSENCAYRRVLSMEKFTIEQHMRSTTTNFNFLKVATSIITTSVKNSISHESRSIGHQSKLIGTENGASVITVGTSETFKASSLQPVTEHEESDENESTNNGVGTILLNKTKSDIDKDAYSFFASGLFRRTTVVWNIFQCSKQNRHKLFLSRK